MKKPAIAIIAACLSLVATAGERIRITNSEYGDTWPFTVPAIELECIDNAVLAHTASRTYALNGKAISRYKNVYPEAREISKPYPGISDSRAKMPPPAGLIQRGLDLCR